MQRGRAGLCRDQVERTVSLAEMACLLLCRHQQPSQQKPQPAPQQNGQPVEQQSVAAAKQGVRPPFERPEEVVGELFCYYSRGSQRGRRGGQAVLGCIMASIRFDLRPACMLGCQAQHSVGIKSQQFWGLTS